MALPDVLIVDDDNVMRAMIKDALKDVPCTLREAETGDAVLAQLEQSVPAVLVLDLIMPGKSGLEVLKVLKSRQLPTRVVVVSSLDTEALVQQAMADGAHGFIAKPFHPLDLQNLVRGALEAPRGKSR